MNRLILLSATTVVTLPPLGPPLIPPPSPRLKLAYSMASSYGEIMTILVQNAILVLLLWRFMKDRPSPLGTLALNAFFVGTAMACAMLPRDYLVLLPLSNLPLIVVAKVPQVKTKKEAGGEIVFHVILRANVYFFTTGPTGEKKMGKHFFL